MYRYEERITFHPLVQLVYVALVATLVAALVGTLRPVPWAPAILGLFFILLPAMFGRLLIQIDAEALTARFGFLGWPTQRIPLDEIVRASTVTYRPIRQFGGWGIRCGVFEGEKTSVYTVRGREGVLLELSSERRISGFRVRQFILGSLEPSRLAAAIGKP